MFEILYDFFEGLSRQAQYFVGGVFGTVLLVIYTLAKFFFQPVRLATMTGSAIANIFFRASQATGMKRVLDSRRMQMDAKAGSAKAHRQNSVNRAVRMREYLHTLHEQRAVQEGPYAIQQYMEDWYDQAYRSWRRHVKKDIRLFDKYEEMVHSIMYQLDERQDRVRTHYDEDIQKLEVRLISLRIRWSRSIKHLGQQRHLRPALMAMVCVRKRRHAWKAANKLCKKLKKERDRKLHAIEKNINVKLKPYLSWLHDFEKDNLGEKVHDFQAAWASSMQTVESGRTLRRLLNPKDPKVIELRRMLLLEHLPWELEELRTFVQQELKGRVGFHPHAALEDVFETWLRVYYLDLGPEKCPDIEPLGRRGFYLWVANLVPPAEKGLANEVYNHQPHLAGDMAGWITPLPDSPRDTD